MIHYYYYQQLYCGKNTGQFLENNHRKFPEMFRKNVIFWENVPTSLLIIVCTYISTRLIQVSRHVGRIYQHCHRPRIRPLVDRLRHTSTILVPAGICVNKKIETCLTRKLLTLFVYKL